MRISDWSSDVCSSDLDDLDRKAPGEFGHEPLQELPRRGPDHTDPKQGHHRFRLAPEAVGGAETAFPIARAAEKQAARLGQPDLASAAGEERRPAPRIERGHP